MSWCVNLALDFFKLTGFTEFDKQAFIYKKVHWDKETAENIVIKAVSYWLLKKTAFVETNPNLLDIYGTLR